MFHNFKFINLNILFIFAQLSSSTQMMSYSASVSSVSDTSSSILSSPFNSYPRHFKGDKCDMQFGNRGALSYLHDSVHYPHITIGHEDLKRDGFHVTLNKGKHIFFKATKCFPYCEPVIYDRVSMKELWSIFNYSNEFALELKNYRDKL